MNHTKSYESQSIRDIASLKPVATHSTFAGG
jgi:hypothetical protein